ncbi:MAG: hypothetical protein JWQ76_4069, partial [Ramlibacter sp.]|nr:hypothetical protein [Ramlibacter sp.]
MRAAELREKLIAEGCNEANFAVNGRASDAYCLFKTGAAWVVVYSE